MASEDQCNDLKIENTLLKERIEQLENLLIHDPHTGLPVRRILEKNLKNLLETAGVNGEKIGFGILRLDKHYNRIRHTRDKMKVFLFMTAMRVKEIIGEHNLYQSDRTDEFLLIVRNVEDEKHLASIADEISAAIRRPHAPPASDISFGCNIGMALYPYHGKTATEIMVNADIALGIFETKKEHGYVYRPELGKRYHENLDIESKLFNTIQKGLSEFHIVYQPIINTEREVTACEALIRWDSPHFGPIPPLRFIPIAEESGSIKILGRWILYNSLRQIRRWIDLTGQDMAVSVNVSPIQLQSFDFTESVFEALHSLKLDGKNLFLEVTESAIMEEPKEAVNKFHDLQENGIDILLDDFGTGYSSLEYLSSLPLNTLKIAKPFIDNMHENSKSMEIVKTIIAMSRNFNFKTLAEGVEHEFQMDELLQLGCDYIQGYYISPPLDPIEFESKYFPQA